MKCKKCGEETNSLVTSGRDGKIKWNDLNYCQRCFSEYRKEKGIRSLREINDSLKHS